MFKTYLKITHLNSLSLHLYHMPNFYFRTYNYMFWKPSVKDGHMITLIDSRGQDTSMTRKCFLSYHKNKYRNTKLYRKITSKRSSNHITLSTLKFIALRHNMAILLHWNRIFRFCLSNCVRSGHGLLTHRSQVRK